MNATLYLCCGSLAAALLLPLAVVRIDRWLAQRNDFWRRAK